ncbi:carboxypeptidase-like regulatory domain-containing protein [Croceitalea rosinachiae]|uniref:Carboxypeptidase-like regulatory domain-containing protein n=1 Tax=Croceitalea rosinachiae TaxID=3075596 RepID=A0ABU3AEW1_9FLAO|nr:carboxypeptidase-like regulatory domain-containing protein [Croceitalea sp. F388]MDT0608072.1 carboxypeptidase-like regulatory domain-containing protein [Croceitalea sp. F388]
MRIVTIVLILFIVPFFGQSQNTITGKVTDELGLPIYLASISIDASEDITYTDYNGEFSLTSGKDFHWKISIKSSGYKTESFFVLSGGSTESIVLEYNEEMKKLLDGHSSLLRKFFPKSPFKEILFENLENSLVTNYSFYKL